MKPPTRRGAIEAVKSIRRLRPEALFLNLPKRMEKYVRKLREEASYEEFMEEVMEDPWLPQPSGAWIKEHEIILKHLPNISEQIDVYCYQDDESFREDAEFALKIALLTVRDAVRGEVKVDEWIDVVKRGVESSERALEREANYISENGSGYGRILCVSGFEAKEMKENLKDLYDTWIKYLGQPYHFPPLEILRRILRRQGEVDDETAEKLVKEHIRFIREYVYYMPFTEAVEKWVAEKLYWMPGRAGDEVREA